MANDMQEHSNLCVGIDLGTTNSVLATVSVKPNGDLVSKVLGIDRAVDSYTSGGGDKYQMRKENTLPSCVYYNPDAGYRPIVGDYAKRRYPLRPYLVAKSIKSQMKNAEVQGLAPEVPDTTPAAVSTRILRHLLHGAESVYRTHIHDAVITVPASFDPVMCRATQDAAALAGVTTEEADGSERPVLLSEPNAVLYDFINQVRTGEIAGELIDLSVPKYVMVFDLGGGTLDITLHVVQRRQDLPDVLKVQDIATNRYTLLGGDDFDEAIAQAMFERYLAKFHARPEIVDKIRRAKQEVLPTLRVFAEDLKIELSNRHSEDGWAASEGFAAGWDDDEEESGDTYATGGNIAVTGIAYDDTFRTEELEAILRPFLGEKLVFDDYHRLDAISDTRNIIFPILDVLRKASEKLGTDDVKIDAVVMNGGMSRFYMVRDRLKAFFGFEPVVALDPDLAVARGAAIYHYYLHQHAAIRDDMRMLGSASTAAPIQREIASRGGTAAAPKPSRKDIEWGRAILPDALSLGLRGGEREIVVPTGAELPYQSARMTGFRLAAGADHIYIPFYVRNLDGTDRRIASGVLRFKQTYPDGAFVAFEVFMNSSKLIRMNAWTCADVAGGETIEQGSAKLVIQEDEPQMAVRVQGPKLVQATRSGAACDFVMELRELEALCQTFELPWKTKSAQKKHTNLAKQIRNQMKHLQRARNIEELGTPLLAGLRATTCEEFRMRCLVLARRVSNAFSEEERRALVALCFDMIAPLLQQGDSGKLYNLHSQAILAIGALGTQDDGEALSSLHNYKRYRDACLWMHARTRSQLRWVYLELVRDCKFTTRKGTGSIQSPARAIGMAFYGTDAAELGGVQRVDAIRELCNAVTQCVPKAGALVSCIVALGWLCDQRSGRNILPSSLLANVQDTLSNAMYDYPEYFLVGHPVVVQIAKKMMEGHALDEQEEAFLLEKMEE